MGTPTKVRLPITAPLLRQIKLSLDNSAHPDRLVLWAVCCTAFFGCFRLGELLLDSATSFNDRLHLSWGDVAVDNPSLPHTVRIHLKQSKTDQMGRGADIILGRTDQDLCSVTAMLGYIAYRGSRPGPFFLVSQDKPLLKVQFVPEIRKVIATMGLPQEQFAGHSFRIGAATSAALAGVEDSTIQLLGRWHSAAFLRYIRTPASHLAELSSILANAGPTATTRTPCIISVLCIFRP